MELAFGHKNQFQYYNLLHVYTRAQLTCTRHLKVYTELQSTDLLNHLRKKT